MYDEQFRPQLHFSPKEKWMNDPNGMVYYKGEYHLFYQYYPHDTVWGPMHWGHAISKDLIHWEELPVALYPDELGQIFSGSAVIDQQNTSGLKTTDEDVMVAIFTHHGEDHEKQSIAYSNDKGRTWTKYKGNPVIDNPGLKDFRDPKVFWHEDSQKWIMSLACGDHIQFYASPNLLEWDYLSEFGRDYGNHGGVWECPDLIQLAVEGTNETKWVLIVSVNPGGPNGGSAVQYFVGDFNGTTFTCLDDMNRVKWADYGRDFYAAVSWSHSTEPIWIGWMNNWQYANTVPTHPGRGAMSIPRKLYLRKKNENLVLVQVPIDLKSLQKNTHLATATLPIKPDQPFQMQLHDSQVMIEAKLEKIAGSSFAFTLKGEHERIEMVFDREKREFSIDRTNSGQLSFSEHFSTVDIMPIETVEDFMIILDRTSIEVFFNQGEHVMTELIFPTERAFTLELEAINGEVHLSDMLICSLESIWK
ncbi:glycoside hydrolase family 32 protein [Peribacillus loiseleuriae]|nr:glycoside hydrolase family 32 protein [Peribacillus loiseleuriae]